MDKTNKQTSVSHIQKEECINIYIVYHKMLWPNSESHVMTYNKLQVHYSMLDRVACGTHLRSAVPEAGNKGREK